jgi:hypothetical protein
MQGVGPNEEIAFSDEPPASVRRAIRVTCPPPAVVSAAVSMLAAPLPADDAPSSRRRPTLRMAELEVVDELTLDASW